MAAIMIINIIVTIMVVTYYYSYYYYGSLWGSSDLGPKLHVSRKSHLRATGAAAPVPERAVLMLKTGKLTVQGLYGGYLGALHGLYRVFFGGYLSGQWQKWKLL